MDFYNSIDQPAEAVYKDRGSKFIGYAFPIDSVDDFKKKLAQVKKDHPKAEHHCFAYRLGLDGNQFRVSDDGEPAGTAGKPILGQIDSKQVFNVCIVVVRYFGGTLLGVPGLINAYKMAALLVLQVVPIVQKPVLVTYSLQFDYTQMNDIMLVIKQLQGHVLSQELQLFNLVKVQVPKSRKQEFEYRIQNLPNVTCSVLP